MDTEMMYVGNAASNLCTQYAREWQQAKRTISRCRWAIKALRNCDDVTKAGRKDLIKRLKVVIKDNQSNMQLIESTIKMMSKASAAWGPGAQWHEKYVKEQAELEKLNHVWDKFESKPLVLDIPDGIVDFIIPGTNFHVWLTYEQYRQYAFKHLLNTKPVDHEQELKEFNEQKRQERDAAIEKSKKEVKDFFLKIFKELPKKERRHLDDAEEMMLIMDEMEKRYFRAKEEDDSHLQVFYRRELKGDENGKQQSMDYAKFAASTSDKVEKRKAEARELEAIRKRTEELGSKACEGCYRKGVNHHFCTKCKKLMNETLKELAEKSEFEILRQRKGGEPDAQYEYIRERILGVYKKKERKFVPYSELPTSSKNRWFLRGYTKAEQEDVINFIVGQVMLMPDVFVSWDIDDCIIKVKSWLCTCKQYYLAGGYCGITDKFEIIEKYFDEQIGIQSKSLTSSWVLVDKNALKDVNCDNLKKVELPNGEVQYYQLIKEPKYNFVDTTKMVYDMEHQDEASEADAIEEIADEYQEVVFERDIYMEGLARAYAIYDHPYIEIVSSLEGCGKYTPKYASYLLMNFFDNVSERILKGEIVMAGLKKRCRAERVNLKAAVELYGIISVWAHAHKIGLV